MNLHSGCSPGYTCPRVLGPNPTEDLVSLITKGTGRHSYPAHILATTLLMIAEDSSGHSIWVSPPGSVPSTPV